MERVDLTVSEGPVRSADRSGSGTYIQFLRTFLETPEATGAIAPSSAELCLRMTEWLDLENATAVAEFGPGTGAFTEAILARLPANTSPKLFNTAASTEITGINTPRTTIILNGTLMSTTQNPNFKNRKTPGVYITELSAFPPSIIGVPTAVPAFIGYTQQATADGKPVHFQPIPVSSLSDFEQIFGAQFNQRYDIEPLSTGLYDLTPSSALQFNLYNSLKLFYANGGSNCYVVSVGDYTNPVAHQPLQQGLDAVGKQVGPTMLVIPDVVLLATVGDYNTLVEAMLDQCTRLQDRFAILDVYGTAAVTQKNIDTTLLPCISQFQDAITNPDPSYAAAYFPFLNTSIVSDSDLNYTNFNPNQAAPPGSSAVTMLQYVLTSFNSPVNADLQSTIDSLNLTAPHDDPTVQTTNTLLTTALPQYQQLLAQAAAQESVLPPSGALAGIYTYNDENRGVWNAPANLSLASTLSATVRLNDVQQGELNVPVNGKAVCVIRDFVGRGSVVWGARTLDGNSNDWRYIQVRRTIIYIEQSIKAALNQYVFAPNDAQTWVTVTQAISNFLQGLWSQGGLMGDKASDAFTVQCGVPQTMTPEDVLNGYMVVQVTLQMVHPAEFIELTFKQTMQGS